MTKKKDKKKKFKLKDCSCGEGGLQPGLSYSDWNTIVAMSYGEIKLKK